jgi:hypothetical protein
MRHVAERHGLSLLQLACVWNLSQTPVKCAIPTLIQEIGEGTRLIEDKIRDLAGVPATVLSAEEVEEIALIGNNKGCMNLKGGNPEYSGESLPDMWEINADLLQVAARWNLDPQRDLRYSHSSAA